jgi:hypothetical protein
MPYTLKPAEGKKERPAYHELRGPLREALKMINRTLESRGNRPLQMDFEQMLDALIYFHLEDHDSGRHLVQALAEDQFAREVIAPSGIKKSSFFEAINTRGLEQMIAVLGELVKQAKGVVPSAHGTWGDLVAIDGSLIDAVLSMYWADYRDGAKKAKVHVGFDLNRGIPAKLFLTEGKGDERPFVSKILEPGQTGVMDRYYQKHKSFDAWQAEGKHFVCRIKEGTTKTVIRDNEITPGSIVFYDSLVLLGSTRDNQTKTPVRLVAYRVEDRDYWVATDRHDLSGEDIAMIYKLRWNIESFFGWWKQHLRVYHLIARSPHGLMMQMLAGMITYLLLAIYCQEKYNEKVSITRVRELRIKIRNEAAALCCLPSVPGSCEGEISPHAYAKT